MPDNIPPAPDPGPPPPIVPEPVFPRRPSLFLSLVVIIAVVQLLIFIPVIVFSLIRLSIPGFIPAPPATTLQSISVPAPATASGYYYFSYPRSGIRFRLPSDFTARIAGDSLHISNHPNFDKSETAAVITVRPSVPAAFTASVDPHISPVLDRIGYSRLFSRFNFSVSGNFIGNPPWGYYRIAILPQPMLPDGLFIDIRLHRQDEMPVAEGGTNGRIARQVSQIISSLEFTRTLPDLELPLPSGLDSAQLEYSLPQEISGVRYLRFQKFNLNTPVKSAVPRSGVLFSRPGDAAWQILFEITDHANDRHNPVSFWQENSIFYSVIVNAGGAGSGEGGGTLVSLNPKTGLWKTESRFYYSTEEYWRYISAVPSGSSLSQAVSKLSLQSGSDSAAAGQLAGFDLKIGNLSRLNPPASVSPAPTPLPSACTTGGCSNELCLVASSPDVVSVCAWKDEYACLKYARCEIQTSGSCGWTYTAGYYSCLSPK